MNRLLDKHAFLWFIANDPRLSNRAQSLIQSPANRRWLSMASLWEIAIKVSLRPSIVKRALRYAVVLGLVLISFNQGDAILHGEITSARLVQMALMVMVPYALSSLSSVGALRKHGGGMARDGQVEE